MLVAGVVVLIGVSVGGLVVARGFDLDPRPAATMPAAILTPSGSPAGSLLPSATPTTATPDPTASAPSSLSVLAKDTIAVVTRAGDGLRVRSAPGVGTDSQKLEPLLRAGARMLVLDGPVSVDGYDWYEVRVSDQDPGPRFGWVASGNDGQSWVRNAEPRCPNQQDAKIDGTESRIEYLVCYGAAPVQVTANVDGYPVDSGGPLCRGKSVVLCAGRPAWLFEPISFSLSAGPGGSQSLYAFAHGQERNLLLGAMERGREVSMTVALDTKEAHSCRMANAQPGDIPSRDELLTECRLRLVVLDAALAPKGP